MDETSGMNRRNLLLSAGAGAGVIAGAGLAEAKAAPISLTGPYLDLSTGEGNMLAKVRLDGNLDESKEKFGSATGIVAAVRPGEAVRDLFGYEVFSAGRIRKQPNGTYRFLHRETIYYTDLKSGEILFEYANPYTGETVKVVDVANDPWDEVIEPYQPLAPSYGGLIKETVSRKPFLMNWSVGQNGMAIGQLHVNLYYPARLQPDKWPRESSGKMNQVSESYVYFAPLADLQNPKLTSVENNGTWSRVTPWLPWMLMGQAPGHILYNGITANFDDINRVKRNVLDHTAKYHPQMMHAPTEWSDVSLSSLEDYARTQKPAPVKTPQP